MISHLFLKKLYFYTMYKNMKKFYKKTRYPRMNNNQLKQLVYEFISYIKHLTLNPLIIWYTTKVNLFI